MHKQNDTVIDLVPKPPEDEDEVLYRAVITYLQLTGGHR